MRKKRWPLKLPRFRKKHTTYAAALLLILYLIFAYNYFYYVQRDAHIDWPDNNHVYRFKSSGSGGIYAALGDSLTYGFGADRYEDSYTYRLAGRLAAGGRVNQLKDYSYPGFRTDNVIKQIDLVISDRPKIITVFIGVNDVHQLIETSNFTKNYDNILYRLTNETDAEIYVVNLPYLGAGSILLPPYNYYFDAKTRSHNQAIRKLTAKYGVKHIDLYGSTAGLFKSKGRHYSPDSFHPSSAGYKLWADVIEDAINR